MAANPKQSRRFPCHLPQDGAKPFLGDEYNAFALPLAAGALYAWGVLLTPALGAVLMSASTIIVAINARLLRIDK